MPWGFEVSVSGRRVEIAQMHIHRCMGSKTISLEDSAYHKLRAAKRPGESFSETVLRILAGKEPSLLDFRGLLDKRAILEVRETIARMKEEDLRIFKRRLTRGR